MPHERPGADGSERPCQLAHAQDEKPRIPGLARVRGRTTCNIDEAALILGIGRSTAYAAAHDGSLPTVRLSHRLLVPVPRLLAMLGCDDR
jgi:excisionase family DNA binding protein